MSYVRLICRHHRSSEKGTVLGLTGPKPVSQTNSLLGEKKGAEMDHDSC